MATVTPAGTASEGTTLNNVIGVIALLAVIALVYFIARGRVTPPAGEKPPIEKPVQQQVEPAPSGPRP
jgi:hypothetical protein